jgi:RNase adaptor protein for sRNA GlmZ degradation
VQLGEIAHGWPTGWPAFGCKSGIHRSVVFANALAERLRDDGYEVEVKHRHLRR